VHFLADDSHKTPGAKQRWLVVESDWSAHRCKASSVVVKVYTDEEKREFERKRAAGEI
jgi:hypothetical protein